MRLQILLERAIFKHQLVLTRRSWRRAVAIAVTVAAKLCYDGSIFNADMAPLLPDCSQQSFNRLEGQFLTLLGFRVQVSPSLFVKYCISLQQLAQRHAQLNSAKAGSYCISLLQPAHSHAELRSAGGGSTCTIAAQHTMVQGPTDGTSPCCGV